MKPLWKVKTLALTVTLAGAAIIPTAGASGSKSSPPDAVVLNGVTAIFGDQRAFFQIPGPNPSSAQTFSLAEGQSANGIQLLSVNYKLESVTIDNHGHVQNIHICTTPVLLAAANLGNTGPKAKSTNTKSTKAGAGADSSADNPAISGDAVSKVDATGLRGGGTSANPNEKSPNSSSPSSSLIAGKDNSTTSSPVSGDDYNSNPTDSHPYVWWYDEAQKIENTRLETAQRVLAGEWAPEPLTPLTPSGTPAQLIGTNSVFLKNGWDPGE
jgi:hypothetical protein